MKYTILLIICLLLVGCTPEPPPIEPPPIPCAELAQLMVIYNGRVLTSNEVVEVPINQVMTFEAKGFDITGMIDACVEGNDVEWVAGCPTMHWENETGLVNRIVAKKDCNLWVKVGPITAVWIVKVI